MRARLVDFQFDLVLHNAVLIHFDDPRGPRFGDHREPVLESLKCVNLNSLPSVRLGSVVFPDNLLVRRYFLDLRPALLEKKIAVR